VNKKSRIMLASNKPTVVTTEVKCSNQAQGAYLRVEVIETMKMTYVAIGSRVDMRGCM
jgi:hypothetical protein